MLPARVLYSLVLAFAVSACAGETTDPLTGDPTGPLLALAPCSTPPPAIDEQVEGIVLPEQARIGEVTEQGPLTQVTGYIPKTPPQVRMEFEQRDDLEVFTLEDEIFEAEALVSNGTHRTYLKVQAICQEGSQFVAVVAAEVEAEQVPTPQGTGAAPVPVPATP